MSAVGRVEAHPLTAAPAWALPRRISERWTLAGVLALAALLRGAGLAGTPLNPFYDAAVRSMGHSWHDLLTGALDPSGQVAIDKPPVDLWLQVASTRLLGFDTVGLLAPGILGGVAAVALLYDLVRTLAGRRAATVAAAAFAVLPLDVITSRSDTMDSVMSATVLGALAVTARGARSGRVSRVVLGGALVGLAFEVKLFEALPAAVPLAVLWLAGATGLSRGRRAAGLGGAAAAAITVGLLWLVVLSVAVPAGQRPWAFGAANGSAWRATFVYNGWERLTGGARLASSRVPAAAHGTVPAAAGPGRLVSRQDGLLGRLGLELAAAWAVLVAVAALKAWRPLSPTGRAGLAAMAAWLALGTVLFSAQAAFRPRYAEAFAGSVAAVLGIGAVQASAALRGRRGAPVIAGAAGIMVVSLAISVTAVGAHAEDAGTLGAMPPARVARLSAFLRDHQDGARYEAADAAVTKAAALIAADGRPQLLLNADRGRPLVGPARLAAAAAGGAVRFGVVDSGCTHAAPVRSDGCSAAARWIRGHGVDVSRAAGQPRGVVYRLPTRRTAAGAAAVGGLHGR